MLWLSERKASAPGLPPGFFSFVCCVTAALLLFVVAADAQSAKPVRSIMIRGSGAVEAETIESWLVTKPGTAFRQSDLARIRSGFVEIGYPFGKVDSLSILALPDSSSVDVILYVSEGKPAMIGALGFSGIRALDETTLRAAMQAQEGLRFLPGRLESDIVALLKLYEGRGYPLARIEIGDVTFDERGDTLLAGILLNVDEAGIVRLRDLLVEGNTTTDAGVVTREARLMPGEVYRGDEPPKVRRRLERLQLFASVAEPELHSNGDGTVTLSVRVVEGNPNRFDGIVGYVPGGSGASGYFTGLLDLQFRNLFGSGRRVGARWHRESQTTQEIGIRYREPWVAALPINADVAFGQRKQDSTYVRTSYGVSAELMATDELDVGVALSGETVIPSEGYGRKVSGENKTATIGFTLSFDSRNNAVSPSSGVLYRTEYHTGIKRSRNTLNPLEHVRSSTQKISFDLEYYLAMFNGQVLAARIFARDIRTASLESSDLVRIGGSNTLRGYREGQFLGSRVAWTNLEYRLLAGKDSFVFAFVDLGYVLFPDRPEIGMKREETRKAGYGAGMRLDTPLGLVGVSLAFGQGDTFSSAKLHIQLVNEF